jgi:hypothetical protein
MAKLCQTDQDSLLVPVADSGRANDATGSLLLLLIVHRHCQWLGVKVKAFIQFNSKKEAFVFFCCIDCSNFNVESRGLAFLIISDSDQATNSKEHGQQQVFLPCSH